MTNEPENSVLKSPRSRWYDVWDQFKSHKGALVGGAFFIFTILAVYLIPLFWPHDATFIDIRSRNQGVSFSHPFGTDQLGRDTFARMMQGAVSYTHLTLPTKRIV